MKINKVCFLALLYATLSIAGVSAQEITYRSPVDFPISLSGNVGEARSNHFHTGLDIRGGGVVGAPIYSVAKGYVSRIFVSPYGYGKALYVTHFDGTTAVYGHLDRFAPSIAQWVENQQYARQSFSVDLYPPRNLFTISRGQVIAYLGNSGSSGGPHLHFELRAALSMNPMNIGHSRIFSIADNVPPIVRKVHLYLQDTVLGVPIFSLAATIDAKKNSTGQYELTTPILYFEKPAYLAYDVIDYKNGSNFTMGIYSMEQKVNGTTNFRFAIDNISFATTRYSNAFTQYNLTKQTRGDVIRAFVAPNNLLHNYMTNINDGIIMPPKKLGERLKITTTIVDDNNNSTNIEFYLARGDSRHINTIPDNNVSIVPWDRDFQYRDHAMTVDIPARSVYETQIMKFSYDGKYYRIGDKNIPLQKFIVLKTIDLIEPKLRSKALFVNSAGHGAGGEFIDGQMVLRTRNFGVYSIAYDTIKPSIAIVKPGANNTLKFKITDNLSGVASYRLTINGKWALAEYDPKTSSLVHRFKPNATPQERAIELKVVDGKRNVNIINTKQKW
ncbi:MAG: M23 family metallopeptidase [Mucinivorans sp.]